MRGVGQTEIARWRMYAQRLWAPRFETAESVVAHLGAMQSQEYAYARYHAFQGTR